MAVDRGVLAGGTFCFLWQLEFQCCGDRLAEGVGFFFGKAIGIKQRDDEALLIVRRDQLQNGGHGTRLRRALWRNKMTNEFGEDLFGI